MPAEPIVGILGTVAEFVFDMFPAKVVGAIGQWISRPFTRREVGPVEALFVGAGFWLVVGLVAMRLAFHAAG